MARTTSKNAVEEFDEHIIDTDITDEMNASYIEYAYSVIYSRAIPDARDGLKPVQRRTLFTMDDMNLRHDRGHVKSARVVGEVMGRLHPHGDSAIYDALVRLVEVVQACRHLIERRDADLDALMRFIPGPDLPTGGKIVGLEGIRDAYATGNGSFRMRATARIDNITPRRKGIVVTELPYNV